MRRLTTAIACTLALTLSACGGDGGGPVDRALDDMDDLEDAINGAVEDGGAQAGIESGPTEAQPPEFVLTGDVEPPVGWIEDPASCMDDRIGPPYFTYSVPADWTQTGSGHAGSGGVGGSGDHSYTLGNGMSVNLDVDTDSYTDDIVNGPDGSPWETWDHDVVYYSDDGERTVRVVYEELDPVGIDGETFDLWYLDESQDETVSASEYKLRIVFGEVPTGAMAPRDRRPESATVTISWSASEGTLDEADAREILATFRLAPCAEEELIELYGLVTGNDWSQ